MDLQEQMNVLEAKRAASRKEKQFNGQTEAFTANIAPVGNVAGKWANGVTAVPNAPWGDSEAVGPEPEPTTNGELSDDDKLLIRQRLGIVKLEDLTLDHLQGEERAKLAAAIAGAARYLEAVKNGAKGLCMALVSEPVFIEVKGDDGWKKLVKDTKRTGYGTGKTTIAKAVADAFATVLMEPGDFSTLTIQRRSKFFTSWELMGLFRGDTFHIAQAIPKKCPLVIIDDIGREGVLPYVKSEDQAVERLVRYFTVINWCYDKKINMVITSNLRGNQLIQHIGEPCYSRLQERMPKEFRFDLTGVTDYRPLLGSQWDF